MRKLMMFVVATIVLASAAPDGVQAQGRGNGKAKAAKVKDKKASSSERDARVLGTVRYDDRLDRYNQDRNSGVYRDPRTGEWYRVRNRPNDTRYPTNRYPRDRDYDSDSDSERYDRSWGSTARGNGNGPAFCRSGAGHPVHGRQWCIAKGYGLGSNSRWERARWDDVIFRSPRTSGTMGRDILVDVLGRTVYGRLDAQRRYFGTSAPLVGRWNEYEGRSVLLVNAGGIPIAELIDTNRDRRVDVVLLNRR